MVRRVSVPGADELFRSTEESAEPPVSADPGPRLRRTPAGARPASERQPSGRIRHDEKMTVYLTSDELLELEHARLGLRRDHALAVDRGRLVREAVAITLADYELNGSDSVLVRRLSGT